MQRVGGLVYGGQILTYSNVVNRVGSVNHSWAADLRTSLNVFDARSQQRRRGEDDENDEDGGSDDGGGDGGGGDGRGVGIAEITLLN